MNILLGVIIGLFVLMFLVTAHEFGHFIMAKRNGVKVEEFGICFPPRLAAWIHIQDKDGKWHWQKLPKSEWGKPQKTLIFSLNLLPIGGFCSMHGESDDDKRPHSFGKATFWQKTKILFGGVAMNWLVAFILFTILGFVGMPQAVQNQFYIDGDTEITGQTYVLVTSVVEDSPASKAGFETGDEIKQANGEDLNTTDAILNFNETHAGETVTYKVLRGEEEKTLTATLNNAEEKVKLGIGMGQGGYNVYRATWSAPIMAAVTTVQLTGATYQGLWDMLCNLFSGMAKQLSPDGATREDGRKSIDTASKGVSGPVSIIGKYFPAIVADGITHILYLAAVISVSLACMNVLPIPALDGGRWLLIAIFRLRKKTLTKETESKIVSRAFVVLLGLILIVTVLDITRLFQ